MPERQARAHYEWVAARLTEDRGRYAPDGPHAPLCVVAGWDAAVLGTTRWEDLLDWSGVFTGDAWGGGIAAAEDNHGASCAVELSIGSPPAGGRSGGPGADPGNFSRQSSS